MRNLLFPILLSLLLLVGHSSWLMAQDSSCAIIWDAPKLLSDTNYNAHSPQIALSGDDILHLTWQSEQGPICLPYVNSSDGGNTLTPVRELLQDSIVFFGHATWPQIAVTGGRVYIFFQNAAHGSTPVRMIMSTDEGSSWDTVRNISPNISGEIRSAVGIDDTLAILYASPYKEILRSTNGGQIWTQTHDSLSYHSRIAISRGSLHLVQNATPLSSIETEYRRSTNLGDTWVQQNVISGIDGFASALAAIGSDGNLGLTTAWREEKYGCLTIVGCAIAGRLSLDEGESFEMETRFDAQPSGYNVSVGTHDSVHAVVWTDDLDGEAKIRLSTDRGASWCGPMTVSQSGGGRPKLAISNSAIHIVWFSGNGNVGNRLRIWYRRGRFQTTSAPEETRELPTMTGLKQNFPNPFNPHTRIGFQLLVASNVSLRIFDVLGREVTTLMDERKDPGNYEIYWNADFLPSGVYYYRLNTGNKVETKKALLMK